MEPLLHPPAQGIADIEILSRDSQHERSLLIKPDRTQVRAATEDNRNP